MLKIYNGNSNKSGVYKIYNKINGRIYVGSAKKLSVRYEQHYFSLKKNKHSNKFLQNDFNKCGEDAFIFEVVEQVDGEERFVVEQQYIDRYFDKQNQCYNFMKNSIQKERSCFTKNPEETKRKLSYHAKKIWSNPNHRKSLSDKMKKKWKEPSYRKIIKNKRKALWSSQEHKNKMSEIHLKMWENKDFKEKHKNSMLKVRTKRGREISEKVRKSFLYQNTLKLIEKSKNVIEITNWNGPDTVKSILIKNANILSPKGILYKDIKNLNDFCKINFPNKNSSKSSTKIHQVINLGRLSYLGWSKYIEPNTKITKSKIDKTIGDVKNLIVVDKYKTKIYGNLICPDGIIYKNVSGITNFCREHNLTKQSLLSVFSGKNKSHKGWKLAK